MTASTIKPTTESSVQGTVSAAQGPAPLESAILGQTRETAGKPGFAGLADDERRADWMGHGKPAAHVFYNRGRREQPFADKPDAVIPLGPAKKNEPSTSPAP